MKGLAATLAAAGLLALPPAAAAQGAATGGSAATSTTAATTTAAATKADPNAPVPVLALDIPQYTLVSNRPDAKIDVGDWRDPRGVYRDLRAATRAEKSIPTTA